MDNKPKKDITAILEEGTEIDIALHAGVREALLQHQRAGAYVVAWRNGKTIRLSPEEITKVLQDDSPQK